MLTRSGRRIQPLIAKEKKKKRTKCAIRFLTCGMIRNSDDDSPHICAFCRKRFNLKASHNLLQCPTCKEVYHLQCMLAFINKSSNNTIACPCCREIVPVQTSDDYVSTDALEKEWFFDFEEVVETDKEFRENVDDSEDEKDDINMDSEDSEDSEDSDMDNDAYSEEGNEEVSGEGSDSGEGSVSSSSDENAEDEE